MKTVKTKLHHMHPRKAKASRHAAHIPLDDALEFTGTDQYLYRIERSPKQEDL
jgi:hypothetical protein